MKARLTNLKCDNTQMSQKSSEILSSVVNEEREKGLL